MANANCTVPIGLHGSGGATALHQLLEPCSRLPAVLEFWYDVSSAILSAVHRRGFSSVEADKLGVSLERFWLLCQAAPSMVDVGSARISSVVNVRGRRGRDLETEPALATTPQLAPEGVVGHALAVRRAITRFHRITQQQRPDATEIVQVATGGLSERHRAFLRALAKNASHATGQVNRGHIETK